MIKRISGKILTRIPVTQAAYQTGRSTTEHVYTVKLLTEMAMTHSNYTIHLLMLDMSKDFDTVNRKTILAILSEILDQDELHILKLLAEDVKLQVKNEEELGEEITTDTGVPQGECMSAPHFILYLTHALKPEQSPEDQELRKNIFTELHPTSGRKESITLEGQYADDMFTITTNIEEKEKLKRKLPQLKKFNLGVSESKTEDY